MTVLDIDSRDRKHGERMSVITCRKVLTPELSRGCVITQQATRTSTYNVCTCIFSLLETWSSITNWMFSFLTSEIGVALWRFLWTEEMITASINAFNIHRSLWELPLLRTYVNQMFILLLTLCCRGVFTQFLFYFLFCKSSTGTWVKIA